MVIVIYNNCDYDRFPLGDPFGVFETFVEIPKMFVDEQLIPGGLTTFSIPALMSLKGITKTSRRVGNRASG